MRIFLNSFCFKKKKKKKKKHYVHGLQETERNYTYSSLDTFSC